MTVEEKLIEEFTAAIKAELGDAGLKKYKPEEIGVGEIDLISKKVKWYLGL